MCTPANKVKINLTKNDDEILPFFKAVREGNIELVKNLLQKRGSANVYGEFTTPLHIAVRWNNLEMVQLLTSAGADINVNIEDNFTPLYLAAESQYLQIAKYLLEQGADINTQIEATGNICKNLDFDGYTPLHIAVQNRDEEMVKMLTRAGADINAKAKDNSTPLYIATYLEFLEIAKYILQHGADVNCKLHAHLGEWSMVYGYAPLHMAVENWDEEMVKLLTREGADVNLTAAGNRTPLHVAAASGKLDIAKHLLLQGADVNAKIYVNSNENANCNGFTPLHNAVQFRWDHIVKLLLTNIQTDLDVVDSNGKTALSLAKDRGFYDIVEIIFKAKEEKKKLQTLNIGNSNVLFFDILKKSSKQLANILGNRDIVAIIESGTWRTNFPIYCDVIMEQFERGKHRKHLVDRCLATVKCLPLTLDCIKQILNYLSNEDVQMLTAVDQIC